MHFSVRGGPDVVLCHRFRLPAANFHDLIHRRPGQGFAEGTWTSHAKGVRREVARQPSRPQMALQSGRNTGYGERQATLATFGRDDGGKGARRLSPTPCAVRPRRTP